MEGGKFTKPRTQRDKYIVHTTTGKIKNTILIYYKNGKIEKLTRNISIYKYLYSVSVKKNKYNNYDK